MSVEIKEINGCHSCDGCETDELGIYKITFNYGLDIILCQHCVDELKQSMIEYEDKNITDWNYSTNWVNRNLALIW